MRLSPPTRERSQGWPSIAPYGRECPVIVVRFIVLPKANIRIESYKCFFFNSTVVFQCHITEILIHQYFLIREENI